MFLKSKAKSEQNKLDAFHLKVVIYSENQMIGVAIEIKKIL